MSPPCLGAILAGGRSRRFGSPKALSEVGGLTLVERARRALEEVVPEVILIVNEPELYTAVELPIECDEHPHQGPLGGIQTALLRAEERGLQGALCVACDMPFLPSTLLSALLREAESSGAAAVAPEGPDRVPEPLCAFYGGGSLPEILNRLARGERSLRALLAALDASILPLADVSRHGDPRVMFTNVNTPADRLLAEKGLRERSGTDGG